ncbi:MAG: plasmid pRiA4b ORF-3 family protein [Spirochaetaceae bacterium]
MKSKKRWQRRVEQLLLSEGGPVAIDVLLREAGTSVTQRSLERYITEEGLAVVEDGRRYYPCWSLFEEGRVLIRPQAWEVDAGILIPGHRLMPLYDVGVPPSELELRPAPEEPEGVSGGFQRRVVTSPLSEVITYFTLFGLEMLEPLLALEDEANMDVDLAQSTDALVRLSACDLSDYYRRVGFREGDYLEARLESWSRGAFSLTHRPARTLSEERRSAWFRTLNSSFRAVIEHFEGPKDIPTQLIYAYFFATGREGSTFITDPGGTIGEFLAADKEFGIRRAGGGGGWDTPATTIWDESEMERGPNIAEAAGEDVNGVTGDLDEILNDIGSMLSEGEVEAYIRDALYQGGDIQSVIGRVFAGSHLPFADPEQAQSLHDELDSLWADVAGEYRPERDPAAPVRSRLLALYDKQLGWVRSLDDRGIDPTDLPENTVRGVGEFFSMITGALELLNQDVTDEGDQLRMLEGQLDTLEVATEEVLETAEEEVTAAVGPVPIYELKVSLKGIRPQIWRRIRVSGTVSLSELHRIIQIAMGWTDAHLHVFYVEGSPYGPAELDELDGYPEEAIRLMELGVQAKQRFRYVYDFGDGWEHDILVSKILFSDELPAEDGATPRVISGKRAAPPEDCGGVPGYHRLLYYLDEEEPESEEREFWRKMVPPGWNPEAFDLEETNELLGGF